MTPNDTQVEPFRLVVTEVTATVVAGWGLPALAATAGVCSLIMLSSWLRGELRHWLENPKAPDQILGPRVLWALLAGSLAFGLVTVAQRGVHQLTFWQTLAMGFWSASLLLAALIDLRSRLLPDRMTLALALFGLALASQNQFVRLDQALLGGLLGYAIPWATNRWAVRSGRGHGPQAPEPTAIGRGDMALLGGVGVWLGPSGVIWVLLASSVLLLLGLATSRVLVLLMRRRSPRTTSGLPMLPMGPAIAACAWIGPASLLQWPAGLDWVAIVADFAT